ncbi:hypothetical protein [Flavobacterium sp.]|uniref:hypothetical protein n=1 Tax=Flavobacterium sp. TaxID=239 RepID=UPI00248879D1|nr:hypothetical protein [Flavobacterium sp.]MDI1317622.1 hypothetical protein [Flavobacterium sp.]
MSERKKIDRLFQEKFKLYEVTPPEVSWATIEAKLNDKKKKRVIPFWWKLSGVAALFLLVFVVSKSIDNGTIKRENSVVNQQKSNTNNGTNTLDSNKKTLNINEQIKADDAVANEKTLNKAHSAATDEKVLKYKKIIRTDNAVVNENSSGKAENNALKQVLKNNASDAVTTVNNNGKKDAISERKNKTKKYNTTSESNVAERKLPKQRSSKNTLSSDKNNENTTENILEKSQNTLVQNSNKKKENNKSTAEKDIVQSSNYNGSKSSLETKNINLDALKGDSNSKIVTQETVKKVNDTAAKNSVVSNALEELLNEKESKSKQESKRNRWQLTSNVAPVFLGSIANGSPIDSTLSRNSKSFNTNVGFGLGVSYAVNKKLSVRTGLNKVNVSYNTNNISFFTAIDAKKMTNVNPSASGANIQIQSNTTAGSQIGSETTLLPFENSIMLPKSGYIRQEMGYLEMPVEMTYNLLDKKFGIKIIGGFSTLFLQDNNLVIIAQGRDTLLGEANNLSDVHFSTNLGLGMKYAFMKSFEFNVEPTLKYQLNTFTDNAGNFKPYIFGIYSGVSYKF